jgi:hypothetical protein
MFTCTTHRGTVTCAACATPWDADYLYRLFQQGRLKLRGFAHVALPTGEVAINYCPRCDSSTPATAFQEIPPWTSLSASI